MKSFVINGGELIIKIMLIGKEEDVPNKYHHWYEWRFLFKSEEEITIIDAFSYLSQKEGFSYFME